MITEDGTGVTGANSYAALADAVSFHSDRANTAWAASTSTAQTAALIQATDYIEANYRALYAPLVSTQGLQWPTIVDSSLPAPVTRATLLLALEALAGPLSPKMDQDTMELVKALEGVGSTKTVYPPRYCDPYPHITSLLQSIATSRLAGVTVGRVLR
jgi:hypothetical protein